VVIKILYSKKLQFNKFKLTYSNKTLKNENLNVFNVIYIFEKFPIQMQY